MSEYRLSDTAILDLAQIVEYLQSIDASPRGLLKAIEARCPALARMPESGRSRESFSPGLRTGLVKGYLAFYRIEGDDIQILRILHGRREIKSIFRESS